VPLSPPCPPLPLLLLLLVVLDVAGFSVDPQPLMRKPARANAHTRKMSSFWNMIFLPFGGAIARFSSGSLPCELVEKEAMQWSCLNFSIHNGKKSSMYKNARQRRASWHTMRTLPFFFVECAVPRYSEESWKPIDPQFDLEKAKGSERVKTQFIIHSAVGTYPGSINWWKTQFQFKIYSTFFVRGSGEIVQLVDSSYYAPANASANGRAISVETDDNTKPDKFPWNDKQLDSLVKLIKWANEKHNIPLRTCPAHDQPGIGFHTMWGNKYSNSPWVGYNKYDYAKTCPGLCRIEQFYKEIMPALGYAPAEDEDDLVFSRWDKPPRRGATPTKKPGGGRPVNKKSRASLGDWNTPGAFGQPVDINRDEQPFSRRIKLV
jgi:hypothetical protein